MAAAAAAAAVLQLRNNNNNLHATRAKLCWHALVSSECVCVCVFARPAYRVLATSEQRPFERRTTNEPKIIDIQTDRQIDALTY